MDNDLTLEVEFCVQDLLSLRDKLFLYPTNQKEIKIIIESLNQLIKKYGTQRTKESISA